MKSAGKNAMMLAHFDPNMVDARLEGCKHRGVAIVTNVYLGARCSICGQMGRFVSFRPDLVEWPEGLDRFGARRKQ